MDTPSNFKVLKANKKISEETICKICKLSLQSARTSTNAKSARIIYIINVGRKGWV